MAPPQTRRRIGTVGSDPYPRVRAETDRIAMLGVGRHRTSRQLPINHLDVAELEVVSGSPEETEALAGRLAQLLVPGDVVLVSGELGTGKTTFVRGACRALGVTTPVTSPTYTIGHRYQGRVSVAHLDLYRFRGLSAAEWGDLEPYFEDAVVFVEWPEAGVGTLPPERAWVRLGHVAPKRRTIHVDAAEDALLQALTGADPGLRHGD